MQLWIVTYNFPPVWAGPVERFIRYVPGFKSRGIKPHFVTRKADRIPEVINGAEVHFIEGSENPARFDWCALWFLLKQRRRVHIALFFQIYPISIPLILLLRLLGIKVVYVSTMARSKRRDGGQMRGVFRQFMVDLLASWVLRSVNMSVSSTSYLKNELAELEVPERKLTIIPNGVDVQRFRPTETEAEKIQLRKELQLPENELIFLFVGLLVSRKGVLDLIRAWKLYKRELGGNGSLVLVGDERRGVQEERNFYEAFDTEKQDIKPQDGIIFRPPSKEVAKYFRAADVFTFLSELEGMPNVLPESMASGMSVLTRQFKGFSKELGEPNKHLIIAGSDYVEIARQLKVLASNTELRLSLGRSARSFVVEKNNVEVSLDLYRQLFERLMGRLTVAHGKVESGRQISTQNLNSLLVQMVVIGEVFINELMIY